MCSMEPATLTTPANEVWKDIEGYEGLYQVSSLGRVRSIDRSIYVTNKYGGIHLQSFNGCILAIGHNNKGYWVNAFPYELLDEPICFLFGDVYYSENAIKTIVKTKTDSIMFFCTYQNHDRRYIKSHDEPLGFKVIDTAFFKYHINKMKEYKDSGEALREPIAWELYRSINGQDLTKHVMTTNYVVINDESCDIDTLYDIINLRNVLGGNMIKLETTYEFTLGRFNELIHITRKNHEKNEKGRLYIGDTFECSKELADYLTGNNKDTISPGGMKDHRTYSSTSTTNNLPPVSLSLHGI